MSSMNINELKNIIKNIIKEELSEKKWIQTAVHPSRKGLFKGKTKTDLEKMKSALMTKSKSHQDKGEAVPEEIKKKISQINFALRAKTKGGLSKN